MAMTRPFKSGSRYATLLAALPFLGAALLGAMANGQEKAPSDEPAMAHARALSRAFRQAAFEASPAVVTIVGKVKASSASGGLRDLLKDPRFRELLPEGAVPEDLDNGDENEEGEELDSSLGSGVIFDKSGMILTNNHVVQGADHVLVRLSDGRELTAKEVRSDPDSDIAVVRIEGGEDLPVARLGDATSMDIGDWVIAIGSPFELELTVSAGIISGKGRGIAKIRRGRLLQTDAAINPGNSGGPLVNLDGEVVGINTAIASSSGGFQGVGFAIPIGRAQWVARELLEHGKVRRAYLGVRIAPIDPEDAQRLKAPIRGGARVVTVLPGGPAAEAGMLADDVIIAFDGEPVRAPGELQDLVEQKPLDSSHEVKILRGGKTRTLNVTVKLLP